MIWKKPSSYIDRRWHAFNNGKAMSLCGEIYISPKIARKMMESLPPNGKCNGCLAAISDRVSRP